MNGERAKKDLVEHKENKLQRKKAKTAIKQSEHLLSRAVPNVPPGIQFTVRIHSQKPDCGTQFSTPSVS